MMMTQTLSRETSEKAERIAAMIGTFHRGTDKQTGVRFFLVPGSEPMTAHRTTALFCSCKGFARNAICSHQAGVARARDRAQNELIALAQRCRVDSCTSMSTTRSQRCDAHFQTLVDELGV
jgi:predicted nucleic acid-binding Zn finger protein